MKESKKLIIFIELTMIFFLVLNFFISNVFNSFLFIAYLVIFLLILLGMVGFDKKKNIYQKRALVNIMIVILAYFLITYLCGLITGFSRTVYNGLSLTNLFKNVLPVVLILVLSELVRFIFINKSNNNKLITILSCIVFIIFTASLNFRLYDFNEYNDIFQFIGIMVLGNISKNIFLTIQCKHAGFINNIIYRFIMEVYIFFVPFVPKLGPYVTAVLEILLPVICAFVVYNSVKGKKLEKPAKATRKNIFAAIIIFIVIVVVMSNSGFFKYQNMTIGSNSMKNYMSKGDVIILEKLKGKELDQLKVGDILVFRYETKIIAHRIYEIIDKGNEKFYRTKGDANDQPDNTLITEDKIIGILRYRIRYIGLPSIWVQEIFK